MKSDDLSLETMRHSASHLMAAAILELHPDVKFAIGPAIENGFYYDFDFKNPLTDMDLGKIEQKMREIKNRKLEIKRAEIGFGEAREMFADQPYKIELINDLEKDGEKKVSIYKLGDFVDLCRGPHMENASEIGEFKLMSLAGAYWRGSEKNKMLTRIYGVAFATKEELENHLKMLEEAKKRDHRKLGPQLGIFFLDETAPGMPYWLPKGTVIVNELLKFWRIEHKKRGYFETITPLLNKKQLYEKSGHWDHYKDYMFICDMGEDGAYCLKPMNCPNAMTIYQQTKHSYRELPLRYSDCDALHRHEKSGELNGLLRVQKFAQDDAHIFVTEAQIADEYQRILEIAKLFYGIFNIKFKIRLGTRPEDFMGDPATWDRAEKDLEAIMKKEDIDYYIGPGEGAFYGPKLDIMMDDCMGREWQTGTIQLDFQLPRKFDLKYVDSDGSEKTPVLIHRVIYGSLERFIGILIEHYAGEFPVWISPVQVKILPVNDAMIPYAENVKREMEDQEIRVEIDGKAESLGKKIRNAEMEKIPYMIIMGEKEKESGKISVRSKKDGDLGALDIKEFMDRIVKEIREKK